VDAVATIQESWPIPLPTVWYSLFHLGVRVPICHGSMERLVAVKHALVAQVHIGRTLKSPLEEVDQPHQDQDQPLEILTTEMHAPLNLMTTAMAPATADGPGHLTTQPNGHPRMLIADANQLLGSSKSTSIDLIIYLL